MSKFLPVILTWVFENIFKPWIKLMRDKKQIEKVITQSEKAAKDLNDAKSDSTINSAIDNLP